MASGSIPLLLPIIKDKNLELLKYTNWLLLLMERRSNAICLQGLPFEITIDPSTICQLNCPYCSVGNDSIIRDRSILKPHTNNRIIADLRDYLYIIWYFSTGEPLLNMYLPQIVAATKKREIFSIISTNLSLKLSDRQIENLLTCGLGCISVSIDGVTAESYSRYRVGGNFDLVINNLYRLVEKKKAMGLQHPFIEWRFLVFHHNADEIDAARELAVKIGVDLLEFFYGNAPPGASGDEVQCSAAIDLQPAVSGPALRGVAENKTTTLYRVIRKYDLYLKVFKEKSNDLMQDNDFRNKCDWLYFGTTLFPNGSVGPCCLSNQEPDDFGSINQNVNFTEVWNNIAYREARSLWTDNRWNKTELICARCPNTKARDYQFRTTMQALLRNAPDWVLKIIVADQDRFFFPVDQKLSPIEFAALSLSKRFLQNDFKYEEQWLATTGLTRWAGSAEAINWFIRILKEGLTFNSFIKRLRLS